MSNIQMLREEIEDICKDKIVNSNVDITLDTYNNLIEKGYISDVHQGWIIDRYNNYEVKPVLYISSIYKRAKYYIYLGIKDDDCIDIQIAKHKRSIVYMSRPDNKKVEAVIKKETKDKIIKV